MFSRAIFLLFICAVPVVAQNPQSPMARSNVEFARRAWRTVQANLVRAAELAPDSVFAFKPTPEVRSFAETLDHVAASERGYCEMALGEQPAGGGAGTGARTKAEVIAALEISKELCERAYAQSEEDAALPAFGGGRATRLHVLLENAMHDGEHHGNIVTYLRLNGLVPPSSQPPSR